MTVLATLQSTNWESSWDGCGHCDISSYIDEPCHQGRVPVYAVLAESAEEIQRPSDSRNGATSASS